MMPTPMTLIGLAVLAVIGWVAWYFDPESRFRRRLRERTVLTDSQLREIFERTSPELAAIAVEVRGLCAEAVNCDKEALHPDDDFGWINTYPLIADLQRKFAIRVNDAEAESTQPTVGSIAQMVHRLKAQHSEPCPSGVEPV